MTTTLSESRSTLSTYTYDEKAAFAVLTGVGLLGSGEFGKAVMGTYLLDDMDMAVDIVLPRDNAEMREEFPEPVVRDAIAFIAEKLATDILGKSVTDLSVTDRYRLVEVIVRTW